MNVIIVIALAAGTLFGWIMGYALVHSGLTRKEWHLLKGTYRALREGKYTITEASDGPDH